MSSARLPSPPPSPGSPPLPRNQFPVTERYRYFDNAGIGPLSLAAAEAMRWWADRWAAQGKVDYEEVAERREVVRADAAQLLGVPIEDVAFVKNTTEGLGFVASGLSWSPGDRVVVPDLEFPSTLYPWLALRDLGVSVDLVPPEGPGRTLPIEAFERVIASGPPPKVVAASWVQFGRGWRTDLAALADLAHSFGALLCADVIQGLGVIPADVEAWGVDFAMADGHKWLCGPEGQGVLYVRASVRDRLRPLEPGWASVAHREEWDNLSLVWADSARRFEGGSFNSAGTLALGASMRLLLDAGVDKVWAYVDDLCAGLAEGLQSIDRVEVLTDRSGAGGSGIVTFAVDGEDPVATAARLNAAGFVCSPRGGGVRIAPHAYNTADEIADLLRTLGH